MNLGTYDINIDFSKLFVHNNTSIYFKEGDLNTAKVRARLTMKNKPINIAGCNVTIRIEPSEGNIITDNATVIDPLNGIIEIDLKSNALLEGTHLFEVWIIKDDSVKKSGKIGYRVLDSIDDAGAIEGTNEYPILISLISDTNKAIQDAKEVLNIAKDMEANVNEAIGNTNIAISNAETATSNANSKITELDDAKTTMITKVDASIDTMKTDVNKAKADMKLTTDAKVKEIDTAITNMNSSVEDAKTDMQATTDAKMQQVDNSIANMKVETNTAIDSMVSKTDEKITDINRAIASGTKDLEVKEARKDANGVVHDTLEQRLKSDLIVGDKSLKDFVVDMNGMKETQDLAYETNTGYKVCNDTQVGVIKDLKLSGKSLVNLSEINKRNVNYGGMLLKTTKNLFKPNTEYTQIINIKSNTLSPSNEINAVGVINESSSGVIFQQVAIQKGFTGTIIRKTTTPSDLTSNVNISSIRSYGITTSGGMEIEELILEGDYTQNPPQYFEGIASVGNGTPLELLTRKEDGNLFDGKFVNGSLNASTGIISPTNNGRCIEKILLLPNTEYIVRMIKGESDRRIVTFFDSSLNVISFITASGTLTGFNFTTPSNCRYATIYVGQNINSLAEELVLNKKGYDSITYKQDKKTVLFKDVDGTWKPVTELRGIDLTACDTIEKCILTSRIGFETLVGTESIFALKVKQNTTTFTLDSNKYKLGSKCLCDKFPVVDIVKLVNEDIIGIAFSGTAQRLVIGVPNSIATTPEQLKTWLTANNVSYLYEKTKIDTYEVNPLDLESFDNMTLWLILSGVIAPPANFKITSSLPNFVKSIQGQVRQLQDQVYKTNVANFTVALNTLDTKLRLDRLEAPQQ